MGKNLFTDIVASNIDLLKKGAKESTNFGGGAMAILQDLPNTINDYRTIFDNTNLRAYTGQLDSAVNSMWKSEFNSGDDFMQAFKDSNLNNFAYADEHWDAGQIAGNVLSNAARGASIGTSFMPGIGTAIGAIAGTVKGGIDAGLQALYAGKKLERADLALQNAELRKIKAGQYGLNQMNQSNTLMQDFNYSDMGGPLSHGTLWNDNVILVDNGGTHEQNPYGGVIIGFDEEGVPNMVEEGEVIYNDYVFSNRLKVPKAMRQKYNLRKLGGELSFADAIKESKQFKTLEEIPNDPIAKRTFESFISDMATSQEELRQQDMMKQRANRFDYGGPYYKGSDWAGFLEWIKNYSQNASPVKGKYRDATNSAFTKYKKPSDLEGEADYIKFTDSILNAINSDDPVRRKLATEYLQAYEASLPETAKHRLLDANGNPVENFEKAFRKIRSERFGTGHLSGNFDALVKSYIDNTASAAGLEYSPLAINNYEAKVDDSEVEEDIPEYKENKAVDETKRAMDAYGLAPILSSLGATFNTLVNRPDYTPVQRYEDFALGLPRAHTHPIGNYTYTRPVDINYLANRLNAQGRNAETLIADLSGGNSASARANIVGAMSSAQDKMGDLFISGYDTNAKYKAADATFNRGTDQYNSEDAYKTMLANLDLGKLGASALMQGARDRFAIDTGYGNALSSNISTATQNAYDWAKYQKALEMINNNPTLAFTTDWLYKGARSSSKGGLLTVKKKGRK